MLLLDMGRIELVYIYSRLSLISAKSRTLSHTYFLINTSVALEEKQRIKPVFVSPICRRQQSELIFCKSNI